MSDFVSMRWIRMAVLAASLSAVWAIFITYGLPWAGLVWVALAVSGALWAGPRSTRSIAQVIDDVEAEPVRAIATPVRVAASAPKAVL